MTFPGTAISRYGNVNPLDITGNTSKCFEDAIVRVGLRSPVAGEVPIRVRDFHSTCDAARLGPFCGAGQHPADRHDRFCEAACDDFRKETIASDRNSPTTSRTRLRPFCGRVMVPRTVSVLLMMMKAEFAAQHHRTEEAMEMSDVRTLSTVELQQGLDRDNGLHVLNVQTDQYFAGELIPGSRRVPLDAITPGVLGLGTDAEIVTYCAGPACSQATDAARKLAELGYTNVRTYPEGLQGWKAAGNEIVPAQSRPAA